MSGLSADPARKDRSGTRWCVPLFWAWTVLCIGLYLAQFGEEARAVLLILGLGG